MHNTVQNDAILNCSLSKPWFIILAKNFGLDFLHLLPHNCDWSLNPNNLQIPPNVPDIWSHYDAIIDDVIVWKVINCSAKQKINRWALFCQWEFSWSVKQFKNYSWATGIKIIIRISRVTVYKIIIIIIIIV